MTKALSWIIATCPQLAANSSLYSCCAMQMLGQVYHEEVAENGGKHPHFGMSTVLDLASKLWLRGRAMERGTAGNAALYAQVPSFSKDLQHLVATYTW